MPEKAPPSAQWWERQRRRRRRAPRGPFQARHCLNSACSTRPPCTPARKQILDNLEVVIVKTPAKIRQSEELLIARARGGSSEAFTDLVCLHSSLTYRVSLTILRNHADAEDNVQDVFYKAYKNIHRFEGRSRFSSWLVRITVN